MDEKLTEQDLDILIESVDAWAESDNDSMMFKTIIGGVLTRSDKDAQNEFEKRMILEGAKFEQNKRAKKKTATLLKAKLIILQQKFMDSPSSFSMDEVV